MNTIDTIHRNLRLATGDGQIAIPEFAFRAINGSVALFDWFNQALARQRSRRELREMTDSQLRDIGITREQALYEADRSFWS